MTSEDVRIALAKPHARDRIERDHTRLLVPDPRPIDVMHGNGIACDPSGCIGKLADGRTRWRRTASAPSSS